MGAAVSAAAADETKQAAITAPIIIRKAERLWDMESSIKQWVKAGFSGHRFCQKKGIAALSFLTIKTFKVFECLWLNLVNQFTRIFYL